MPAERSTKRNATGRLSNTVEPCIICGKVVSRSSDIPRHMAKHNADAKKIPCPWEGCKFSTRQQSNLDTHYRRHTGDQPFLCSDDPNCNFQTCDPASLLRHRKNLHNYIPRPVGRKTDKPTKPPAPRTRKAPIYSSSSPTSSVSLESSRTSISPIPTLPSSTTSSFYYSSSGESESTPSTPESLTSLFNESLSFIDSSSSSPHQKESLPLSDSLSPCSYNYAWDTSILSELDLLATAPEMEELSFQYPHQGQQEESQSQQKDFSLPLQWPNMEQVFPGYETTGQLHGSYGLDFRLEPQTQQVPLPEVDSAWIDLSFNGSPIFQYYNPATEFFQPNSSLTQLEDLPVFTDNVRLDQVPYTSTTPDLQTYVNPDFNLSASPLTDHNNCEVNLSLRSQVDANLDFINSLLYPCWWDFGSNPAFGIVEGLPSGGLRNPLMIYS